MHPESMQDVSGTSAGHIWDACECYLEAELYRSAQRYLLRLITLNDSSSDFSFMLLPILNQIYN